MKFIFLIMFMLMLPVLHAAEDKVTERWDWLIDRNLIVEHGQPASYKKGCTLAVRRWLDFEKAGRNLYWSPLIGVDADEQRGYFDGLQLARKVIRIEIASAIGVSRHEIAYYSTGMYSIIPSH